MEQGIVDVLSPTALGHDEQVRFVQGLIDTLLLELH